jgi:hypothetical protein
MTCELDSTRSEAAVVVGEGQAVDAILLSDCVPGWHSDYNDGFFATADAVRSVYLSPPTPVELSLLREDLAETKRRLETAEQAYAASLAAAVKQNDAMAEYLRGQASELRSAGNKCLQYSRSTTDNLGLGRSFLSNADEIESLLAEVLKPI